MLCSVYRSSRAKSFKNLFVFPLCGAAGYWHFFPGVDTDVSPSYFTNSAKKLKQKPDHFFLHCCFPWLDLKSNLKEILVV